MRFRGFIERHLFVFDNTCVDDLVLLGAFDLVEFFRSRRAFGRGALDDGRDGVRFVQGSWLLTLKHLSTYFIQVLLSSDSVSFLYGHSYPILRILGVSNSHHNGLIQALDTGVVRFPQG